jgi:hypothetical protein
MAQLMMTLLLTLADGLPFMKPSQLSLYLLPAGYRVDG